jgi:sigma-E factor negative regulatory protein RseC
MIDQNVQVVRCRDERLWVRIGSQTGCTACDNGKGCGAGLFAKLLRRKPVVLELARNDIEIEQGQMLTLSIPENIYIKLVFVSYGWPLLAALAGAIAGHSLCSWLQLGPVLNDAGTLLCGVLAGGIAVIFVKKQEKDELILNSLNTTVYYPAVTPNMCSRISSAEPQ